MIVGLDMGGTHIDAIIMRKGEIIKVVKKPTNYDDLFQSIWSTLNELLQGIEPANIKKINLSTTISTNAIVENKTAPVGMIIQSGPGLPNEHLAVGYQNVFVNGYTDHRGEIIKAIDPNEILMPSNYSKRRILMTLQLLRNFRRETLRPNVTLRNLFQK